MTPAERMEAAAERFAANIARLIEERVTLALELERDRHDAQLAVHREQIAQLSVHVATLAGLTGHYAQLYPPLHSVKVPE